MAKSNKNIRKYIYLDHASSALSEYANPGAIHELGVQEKNKLKEARKIIANILRARSSEIIFTSGATESNNLAILGLVQNFKNPHIITTNVEHPSILEVCRHLEKTKQATVTYVEVEPTGIVDPRKIKKALKPNTVLVSVMYANNEIGTVQPIKEIAKEVRHFNKINSKKVFFHTDATQAVNYLSLNVSELGVDLMSFNGAKIYGPKGVGVLYVKKNIPLKKIMFGGDQEFGLRPGTENVALDMELARALEVVEKNKEKEVKRLTTLRDYFIKKLILQTSETLDTRKTDVQRLEVNGDLINRLPNNVNITFPKIPSDLLVIELSAKGIMASSKSACKSSEADGSYVVAAIHPELDGEIGGVRFSLGRETTKNDIDYTVKALIEILNKLKKWY
ncbi:MAG: cysteine desulfurase family protein [Candidatus Pacebacteria bacterium]|nr:cysteine desulfurase family protein [Candidatus Paceibacterota bacterium]